jgi:hypothetical protein
VLSELKMEVSLEGACSHQTLVTAYQIARCLIPEDGNIRYIFPVCNFDSYTVSSSHFVFHNFGARILVKAKYEIPYQHTKQNIQQGTEILFFVLKFEASSNFSCNFVWFR